MESDEMFTPKDEDAIIKEVHNTDNIEAKTELNLFQIESVNRLQTLGYIFNNKLIEKETNGFLIKLKSLNRSSMREFVDSLGRKRDEVAVKNNGLMPRMLG